MPARDSGSSFPARNSLSARLSPGQPAVSGLQNARQALWSSFPARNSFSGRGWPSQPAGSHLPDARQALWSSFPDRNSLSARAVARSTARNPVPGSRALWSSFPPPGWPGQPAVCYLRWAFLPLPASFQRRDFLSAKASPGQPAVSSLPDARQALWSSFPDRKSLSAKPSPGQSAIAGACMGLGPFARATGRKWLTFSDFHDNKEAGKLPFCARYVSFSLLSTLMKPETLSTRGVIFAVLFGPPRFISSEEASKVHGELCRALAYGNLSFTYTQSEPSQRRPSNRTFSMVCERTDDLSLFKVIMDHGGEGTPIRLLVENTWAPLASVCETTDIAAKTVMEALEGEWSILWAETRIRAQCQTGVSNSLDFLTGQVLNLNRLVWEKLDPRPESVRIRVESPEKLSADPLAAPRREINIEVLKADRSYLYFELVSTWPGIGAVLRPEGGLNIGQFREMNAQPSEHIRASYDFLKEEVLAFFDPKEAGDEPNRSGSDHQ